MFQKELITVASISLVIVLGACAGRPAQGVLVPVAQSAEGTSRVNVLVATTRQRSVADAGESSMGSARRMYPMLLLPFQFRLTTPERVAKSTGPRPFLVILIAISSLIRRIISTSSNSPPPCPPRQSRPVAETRSSSCMASTTGLMMPFTGLHKSFTMRRRQVFPFCLHGLRAGN